MNKTSLRISLAKIFTSILLFAIHTVWGCTSGPIKSQELIPGNYDMANKHPFTVSLHVDGGREFSPLKTPQISNEALMQALHQAIISADLFNEILESGEDYKLNLYIFKVTHPLAGSVMTARVEIGWTLTRRASMQIVWQESILTSDSASSDEVLNANSRLKMAIEKAARKNIQEGIRQISQLGL